MRDVLKAYLALAGNLTDVTRQRAVAAARVFLSQGEATAEQVTALAEDIVAQSRANREAVTALAKFEVDRALGRVGLASADEVGDLTARIRVLETDLRNLRAAAVVTGQVSPPAVPDVSPSPTPGQQAPGQPAPGQQAPAKKAPARGAPALKPSSRRAAAKKAPAPDAQAKAAPAKAAPAKAAPAKAAPAVLTGGTSADG